MNKKSPLYICGLVLILMGLACAIAAVVLSVLNFEMIANILFIASSLFGVASMVIFIYRLNVDVKTSPSHEQPDAPKTVIKVVDVKEVPKTKQQMLYEQYENLYKQNLITKEELEQKKNDLLG